MRGAFTNDTSGFGCHFAVITRAEFQDIIKLEGQARGSTLNTDAACVESQEGKAGLRKVEDAFRQLGYPVEYKHIKDMGWYPICLRILSLRVIQDVFGLNPVDVRTMGDMAPKFSFLVKVFMKFTRVTEPAVRRIPGYWRMHYNIGDMCASEVNSQAGYVVIQLTNFETHQILCSYFEGYFRRLLQFSFADQSVESKETKCMFRGDSLHEYRITWK